MKNLILMTLMLFTTTVFAQKVDIGKDNIVKIDGKPAFIIEGKMKLVNSSFTVSNLDQEGLIFLDIDPNNENFIVVFKDRNERAIFPSTIGLKKVLANELVRMKVIENGDLNEVGMKRFLAKYGAGYIETPNIIIQQPNQIPIVSRDRSAPIFAIGGTIKQDFRVIGHYSSKSTMIGNMPGKIIQFFAANSQTLIAEAAYQNFSESCDVTLYYNANKRGYVQLEKNATDQTNLETIILYLINNGDL